MNVMMAIMADVSLIRSVLILPVTEFVVIVLMVIMAIKVLDVIQLVSPSKYVQMEVSVMKKLFVKELKTDPLINAEYVD